MVSIRLNFALVAFLLLASNLIGKSNSQSVFGDQGLFNIIQNILQSQNVSVDLSDSINPYSKEILALQETFQIYLSLFNNNKCGDQILFVLNSTLSGEEWAMQMLDASAKPQAGILYGNVAHLGNFDECINIKARNDSIFGKYCLAEITATDTATFDIGLTDVQKEQELLMRYLSSYAFCVPNICTVAEIQEITDYITDQLNTSFKLKFHQEDCIGEERQLSRGAIIAISIFAFFAIIIIFSTAYDIYVIHINKEIKANEFYTSFSFYTNGIKLFKTDSNEGTLKCLNGLRVISMMWIILIHRFLFNLFMPLINGEEVYHWHEKTESAILTAGDMAVDTFFLISGLLVGYLFLKSVDRGDKISVPMFYFHRIIRLMPSLLMVILFTGTLPAYLGNGPIYWQIITKIFQEPCEENWWSTLLYLQNYLTPDSECVGQSWYLAVDTQMYFISPIFLFSVLKWPKITVGVITVLLGLNSGYIFEVTWRRHLGTVVIQQTTETFTTIYIPTHVRGAVYLLGLLCGIFIYKTSGKGAKIEIKKIWVIFLWILSATILLSITFLHSYFTTQPYDVLEASLYNAFNRIFWGIGLCILIILCVNGYGYFINYFLSLPIFTVLIRVNYSMYLLHSLIIIMQLAQVRTSVHFLQITGFHQFWGDFMFTLAASIVWTLAFESPIRNLEKVFFSSKPKKHVKQIIENDVENGNSAIISNKNN